MANIITGNKDVTYSTLGSNNQFASPFIGGDQNVIAGRVISIVLDDSHPRFKELGGWTSIGTIEYSPILNSSNINVVNEPYKKTNPTSKPLGFSLSNFPLIGETVYIIGNLPDNNTIRQLKFRSNRNYNPQTFYINTLNFWGSPHHNAYPIGVNSQTPLSQNKNYLQTQVGSRVQTTPNQVQAFLGLTFDEKSNIHPLTNFEGDIILEGRWGNSIRFGSTVIQRPNSWSSTGSNGAPITILRNGQGTQANEGWIPITENINNDDSSIYLTSTQNIPINVSSTNNYYSYKTKPTAPNQYAGRQIILNSGRLVFNTTEDHLLLSSKKSINLNSVESINFDTTQPIILSTYPVSDGGGVFLGSKIASESVLLGDSTIELLKTLLKELQTLTKILSVQVGVVPGASLAPTNTQAALTNITITNLLNQLEGLKSKTTKVI